MVFSTNQVRQLYVVTGVPKEGSVISNLSDPGTIAVCSDKQGNVYFQYRGADNLMRSDIINIDNILYTKAISAEADSQMTTLKRVKVTLDSDVNEGTPIGGQDYILRICINPYVGMSGEEPYYKYGSVHAKRNMTPAQFYTELAASLYRNFSKELGKMLEFSVDGKAVDRVKTVDGETILVDREGEDIELAENYKDGVTITEVEQEWTLGIKEQTSVDFTVTPTTVTYDGDEVSWGKVATSNPTTTRNNGRKIADLEYFCMGERGDQYRNIGWPNSIPTHYLVNSDEPYNIFEIHYAYVGPNEGPQRSEKDITIVCADKDVLDSIIEEFTEISGLEIEKLTEEEEE